MEKKLFDELMESVRQANEIVHNVRAPSRQFVVESSESSEED